MSNDPEEVEALKHRCSDMGTALTDAIHRLAALEAERDALREAVREWREARAEATECVSPETWARLADAESRLAKHGGTNG